MKKFCGNACKTITKIFDNTQIITETIVGTSHNFNPFYDKYFTKYDSCNKLLDDIKPLFDKNKSKYMKYKHMKRKYNKLKLLLSFGN